MEQKGLLIVKRLLEKRFGALPPAIEQHLARLPVAELEDLSLRISDINSLDELLTAELALLPQRCSNNPLCV
jgi:hypothetical protein